METSQIETRPIAERQIGAVRAMATGGLLRRLNALTEQGH